jgi:16S rRNA (cytidine1402-2'-O)-methyltransferase
MPTEFQSGVLYIVSTPIGNLEDISLRAINTLQEGDIIAAEDTRTTKKLLNNYGISKPLVSYHDFNERQRSTEFCGLLKSGRSIALVSDAGTPGISDPGFRIIRNAIEEGIRVVPIPGPTAFLTALIVSGVSLDSFVFEGFLPHKKGRSSRLEQLSKERRTVILYESPHRLLRTLTDIGMIFGNRHVAVARELTKKFEEVVRGRVSEVIDTFSARRPRGEFVIVISPKI